MSMTTRTPLTRQALSFALVLFGLLVFTLTSCSSENSGAGDDAPTFNGVDPTLSCAGDTIGWNFATGGSSLDSAQGSALSGIQITEASYGVSCNAGFAGNATLPATALCNGQYHCEFQPYPKLFNKFDPSPGCNKTFTVKWKCGADSDEFTRTYPGESAYTNVAIDCGPKVALVDVSYGGNCGTSSAEESARAFDACDKHRNCAYTVDGRENYTPGCAKSFVAQFRCTDDGTGPISKVVVPAEAKGQKVFLSCDGSPHIKIQSAHYGDNCALTKKVDTTPLQAGWADKVRAKCDALATCDYAVSNQTLGDPTPGCGKDFKVTYTCGENPTVVTAFVPAEASGKTAHLSCAGATGYAPPYVIPQGTKACVPKSCKWNESRAADMSCVADASIQKIDQTYIESFDIVGSGLGQAPVNPGGAMLGALKQNTPYDFTIASFGYAAAGHWQMSPWLTARFNGPGGQQADGFLCALSPVDMDNAQGPAGGGKVNGALRNNILPSSCFDVRSNAAADLAKRLRTTESEIRSKWTLVGYQVHFSIDIEGKWGLFAHDLPATSAGDPLKPNPPGFFYDQDRNYLDQIAYYQQRELRSMVHGVKNDPWDGRELSEYARFSLTPSNTIEVKLRDVKVANGANLAIDYFEPSPSINVDVNWVLLGDSPLNPASPTNLASAENLNKKNLRATVLVYPSGGDESSALVVGSIPLDAGSPTGATSSASMTLPDTIKDRIFGAWSTASALTTKTCIDVDGLNTRPGNAIKFLGLNSGATPWSYMITNQSASCRQTSNAIFLSRSITKKPLPAEKSSSNISNTKSNKSGDSANSSANDTASEKTCANTTVNGSPVQTCTAETRGGTAGSGNFSQSLYSADSSSTRVETKDSVSATPRMTAEALGFQVIDVEDDSHKQEWGKTSDIFHSKESQKLSITPNWNYILATNKTATGVVPGPKLEKGKYGGRDGLGLAFGYKVPFGGFGILDVGFDIGVSISLDFELRFQPDDPYPCITANGKKCYAVFPAKTQVDAQTACQVRGGKLAEMNTAADRNGILVAASSPATDYWIGGQLAYSFSTPACARNQSTDACKNESKTTFRWIGSDVTFASIFGQSTAPVRDGLAIPTSNEVAPLRTKVAADAGVVFRTSTAALGTDLQSVVHPAICEFDPAVTVDYSQWSLALHLGAGAGVHMQFCVPSATADYFGLCIRGQLNFVDIALSPTYGHSNYDLYDATGRKFGGRGNTFLDIPWKVNLLAGRVDLTANYFFGSATWNLFEYEGFKVAGGSLYTSNSPTREVF